MNPGDELRSEIDVSVTAGATGGEAVAGDVRETGVQVLWGVGKLFIIMLAAFLGAMVVETARAIF